MPLSDRNLPMPARGIYRRRCDGRRVLLRAVRSEWAIVWRLDRIGNHQRPYRVRLDTLLRDYTHEGE